MAQEELLDLIRKEVAEKKSRETIVSNLIFSGWKYRDIEGGFAQLLRNGEVSEEFSGKSPLATSHAPSQDGARRVAEEMGPLESPRTKFEVASELVRTYEHKALIWIAGILTAFAAIVVGYAIYNNATGVIIGRALRIGAQAPSYAYHLVAQGPVVINYQETDLFKRLVLPIPEAVFTVDGSFARTTADTSALSYSIDARGPQEALPRWQANIILPDTGGSFVQVNAVAASSTQWQAALDRLAQRWIGIGSVGDLSQVPFVGPRGLWSDLFSCRLALGGQGGNVFSFLSQPGVVTNIERMNSEQENGVPVHHFKVTIDGTAAVRADPSLASCLASAGFTHWETVLDGQWDFLVNKQTLEPVSLSRADIAQSADGVTVGISSISILFGNWGSPLSIAIPQSFLSATQAAAIISDTGPAGAASSSSATTSPK